MGTARQGTESIRKAPSSRHGRRWPRLGGPIGVVLPGLLALAATTGCGSTNLEESVGLTGRGQTTATESHKNFQTFEYTNTPGLAFSTDLGAISHATITRMPGGGYWLDLRVWGEDEGGESRSTWEEVLGETEWMSTDEWADDGWDSDWSWQEPTEQELMPRELAAGEVQRMLSVFASIPVDYEYVDSDIDYYYLEDVRWDDRSLSANPTFGYSETIPYTKLEEIVQMLKDFAAATEA